MQSRENPVETEMKENELPFTLSGPERCDRFASSFFSLCQKLQSFSEREEEAKCVAFILFTSRRGNLDIWKEYVAVTGVCYV